MGWQETSNKGQLGQEHSSCSAAIRLSFRAALIPQKRTISGEGLEDRAFWHQTAINVVLARNNLKQVMLWTHFARGLQEQMNNITSTTTEIHLL